MGKWIGAALIILGCGGCGFSMARNERRQEQYLICLLRKLEFMRQELSCRVTPLPELFASAIGNDCLSELFSNIAVLLSEKTSPNASVCMEAVLTNASDLPEQVAQVLTLLGSGLGCFDLDGQLQQLSSVIAECHSRLDRLAQGRDVRLRNYRTVGLCAGAGLAILLL